MPIPKLLDRATGEQRLDRYELIGEIAQGGMATVFLARVAGAGGFQRFFAIKRLHPNLAGEAEFVQMFLDEARLAASIHHPHVVPILEVGTSPAGYYVVMEYIEGDTLARLAARAADHERLLPAPVALRVVLDALSGLHAAHELTDDEGRSVGLVHRDVSPQNILVGVDGASRLTDFGVARATSRLANTQSGTLKGKLAYMPPEQTQGSEVDRRADVFAMGVVLWEVLAGERLFKGASEAETLKNLLFKPIPTLASLAPALPAKLSDVVRRALERDVDQRYASAADFSDALEGAGLAPASPREVAAYVQSVLGEEVQQQRSKVRAWLAQSEPSQAPLTSRAGVLSLEVDSGRHSASGTSVGTMAKATPVEVSAPREPPRSSARLIAPLAIAALVASAIAGWALTRPPAPAPAGAPLTSSATESASAPPSAAPAAIASTGENDPLSINALPSSTRPALGKPWPKRDGKDPDPGKPGAAGSPGTAAPPPATPVPPPATAPPPPPPPPADDGYKNPYR